MCRDCKERWALSNGRCYQCLLQKSDRDFMRRLNLTLRHGDKPEVLRLRMPETSAPAEAF